MLINKLGNFLRVISRYQLSRNLSTLSNVDAQQHMKVLDDTGTDEALQHEDYFNVHNLFTVWDMFNAKVHLGHKTEALDNRMKPFIFGSRMGITIFDLDVTAYHLRKALNFCAHMAYRDGIILFLSERKLLTLLVERTAKECGEFAHARDWTVGTFTNSKTVFNFDIRLPDLCIFLSTQNDCGQSHPGIVEAAKNLIPTIAIVDSNCNPNLITYPVPGNDDSVSSVSFFCKIFQQTILRAKALKKNQEKR